MMNKRLIKIDFYGKTVECLGLVYGVQQDVYKDWENFLYIMTEKDREKEKNFSEPYCIVEQMDYLMGTKVDG